MAVDWNTPFSLSLSLFLFSSLFALSLSLSPIDLVLSELPYLENRARKKRGLKSRIFCPVEHQPRWARFRVETRWNEKRRRLFSLRMTTKPTRYTSFQLRGCFHGVQVCSFVSFRISLRRCWLPDALESEVLKLLLSPLDRCSNSDFRGYNGYCASVFYCMCVICMIRMDIGKYCRMMGGRWKWLNDLF